MTITMTELAKQLKLSQATVSLVLNNRDKSRVRPELAEQIREAAREAGFRPNRAAGELRRRKSHAIGILLPSSRNLYYAELVADIHQAIRKRNYAPMFAFWENDDEKPEALESILDWNPDGLITIEPEWIPANAHQPAVSFYIEDPRYDCIKLDLERTIHLEFEHLRELGHSSIAWLGNPDDERFPIIRRLAPEYGFELRPEWIVTVSGILDFVSGREMLEQLLKQAGKKLPTAILAHHDMAALGICRKMHELGYKVPEDFTIIGHDHIQHGQHSIPTLTTVRYAAKPSVGDYLVETLFERIENPDSPRKVMKIEPKLIIGESSGPPRKNFNKQPVK